MALFLGANEAVSYGLILAGKEAKIIDSFKVTTGTSNDNSVRQTHILPYILSICYLIHLKLAYILRLDT